MAFIITTVGGSALIGAIGTIGGGMIANRGAKKAAQTQADAADRAGAISDAQFQQTRTDQLAQLAQQREDSAPYRKVGTDSLAQLASGTAADGEFTKNYERSGFEVDPGRLYRLSQGESGINRAAAARGGWNSGATLKALARFNSDQASQEYGAWDQRQNTREAQFNANRDFRRNNLATLAGIGQTATTATSNAGANAYGQIAQSGQANAQMRGQALQNAGEARASGYVSTANAIGGGIKSIFDSYQQGQYMGAAPPRAGGTEIANWQNWGE